MFKPLNIEVLEPGDEVGYLPEYGTSRFGQKWEILTVAKRTKTTITLANGARFNNHGKPLGDRFMSSRYPAIITSKNQAEKNNEGIERSEIIRALQAKFKKLRDTIDPQAESFEEIDDHLNQIREVIKQIRNLKN